MLAGCPTPATVSTEHLAENVGPRGLADMGQCSRSIDGLKGISGGRR
jgi:hypothetical protein